MPKMSMLVLSTLTKHQTGSFEKAFRVNCRTTVLMSSCSWLSSNCNFAQTFASMPIALDQNLTSLVLDFDKDGCFHILLSLYEFDNNLSLSGAAGSSAFRFRRHLVLRASSEQGLQPDHFVAACDHDHLH